MKLGPGHLAAITAACAVLLFGGEGFLARLGLFQFAENCRAWLGAAFLAGCCLLVVWMSGKGILAFQRWGQKRKLRRRMLEVLHALSEKEKEILRFYLFEQTRSNKLHPNNGNVHRLVAAGILHRASNIGNALEGFAHNISDAAWHHLNEHPSLLDGVSDEVYTDDRDYFSSIF